MKCYHLPSCPLSTISRSQRQLLVVLSPPPCFLPGLLPPLQLHSALLSSPLCRSQLTRLRNYMVYLIYGLLLLTTFVVLIVQAFLLSRTYKPGSKFEFNSQHIIAENHCSRPKVSSHLHPLPNHLAADTTLLSLIKAMKASGLQKVLRVCFVVR